MAIRGAHGGRVRGDCELTFGHQQLQAIALLTTSARSLMDRASDYGSEGWKFESSRARQLHPLNFKLLDPHVVLRLRTSAVLF